MIYTYDGWTGVVYFSEEVRDPGRSIPRALFAGVLTLTAIYVLVNLSFLYVLPVGAIAGEEFAAGAVASALFGDCGGLLLRVLTIVSMLSAVNAYHLMASRVLFSMGRDGLVGGPAARSERRRHADGRIAAQHGRRRAVHRVRPDLRKGHHAAGVLLHRQLHAVVRFLDRPSTAGA